MLFCSLDQSVYELIVFSKEFYPGGAPHMKGVGMLVVSLRGVKFAFWSHLGCFGQNAINLAVKVSFRVASKKI